MDLQAALQGFLVQIEADGRSPHTIGQYRRHVTALIAWLQTNGASTDVADLTPGLLARFFADGAARDTHRGGRKKATSLNAMRTSIRCFAAHLHDAGHVAANPARLLRRARCTPPPPRALHSDEQERLLTVLADAAGPEAARDRTLVELLLGTGIRIGSAIALDVKDVDLGHGEITLRTTKNDRPATVFMPQSLVESMLAFVGERATGPLFLARDRRISMRHAQRRLAKWMCKANIAGRSAHTLRHTFAAGLLARTGNLRLVQAALNHASIVSTTVYTSVNRDRLRAAIT